MGPDAGSLFGLLPPGPWFPHLDVPELTCQALPWGKGTG